MYILKLILTVKKAEFTLLRNNEIKTYDKDIIEELMKDLFN